MCIVCATIAKMEQNWSVKIIRLTLIEFLVSMRARYPRVERASDHWKALMDHSVRHARLDLDVLESGCVLERPHVAPTEVWFSRLADLLEGSEVSTVSEAPFSGSVPSVVPPSPATVVVPPVVVVVLTVFVLPMVVPSDVVTVSKEVPYDGAAVFPLLLTFVSTVLLPIYGSSVSVVTLAGVSSRAVPMVIA